MRRPDADTFDEMRPSNIIGRTRVHQAAFRGKRQRFFKRAAARKRSAAARLPGRGSSALIIDAVLPVEKFAVGCVGIHLTAAWHGTGGRIITVLLGTCSERPNAGDVDN